MSNEMEPPQGFAPHFRKSMLTEPWEPIFSRTTATAVVLGLFARDVHCNSRHRLHGGVIAALADNAMGLSCAKALMDAGRDASGLVTINLSIDYLGSAELGQWVTFETEYVRPGGLLSIAQSFVRADGHEIARANATFRGAKTSNTP